MKFKNDIEAQADISVAGAAYINQLGPTGTRAEELQLTGTMLISEPGSSATGLNIGYGGSGTNSVQIGRGRIASGESYLDLQGDTGGVNPGFRILRSAGANASTAITHYGTANLTINAQNGADTVFTNTKVGIGTTSPLRKLHVDNSSGVGEAVVGGTTGATLYFRPNTSYSLAGNFGIFTTGLNSGTYESTMDFKGYYNGITTPLTIKGSGNVGIGTTSPTNRLQVQPALISFDLNGLSNGAIALTNNSNGSIAPTIGGKSTTSGQPGLQFITGTNDTNTGADMSFSVRESDNTDFLTLTSSAYKFSRYTTSLLEILRNGNVGIGTTSPDAKLEITTLRESGIRLSSSDTTAAVNELLNGIDFYSPDFLNEGIKASIKVNYADVSANSYMTFSTGANTERMRIDEDGNVGIGTTSPLAKLTVSDSTNSIIRINNTKNANWTVDEKLGSLEFYGNDASGGGAGVKASIVALSPTTFGAAFDMAFQTNDGAVGGSEVEHMRIKFGGNVGIGTDSPSHELTVQGSASPNIELKNTNYSDGGFVLNRSNYGQQWKWWAQSGLMYFGYSTDEINYTNHLTIKSDGKVGIGTTNPQSLLHISDDIGLGFTMERTGGAPSTYTVENSGDRINHNYVGGSNGYRWQVEGATKVSIKSDGNVGIGTDSPSEKLQVVGDTLLNSVKFSRGGGQQFISTGTGTTINFGQPTSYVQNVYVQGKIQANSSVMVGDNTATPSSSDAGAIRYRVSGNNSYVDVCMRTGSTTYAWVNIVQNQW